MAENTTEFNNKDEQWQYAQKVAADAIKSTGVGNEDVTAPETVEGQGEKEVRAFTKILTAETAVVNNLGGTKGSNADQREGGGQMGSIKEFMDKHPRVKQLATAFLVSSTLGMAACASPYELRTEEARIEYESDKAQIDAEHKERIAVIQTKHTGERLKEEMQKENERYIEARSRAISRHDKDIAKIGEKENKGVIREEERSGRRVDKTIGRSTEKVVETTVDGIFGRGTERSRSRRISRTLGNAASDLAVESARSVLRNIGVSR